MLDEVIICLDFGLISVEYKALFDIRNEEVIVARILNMTIQWITNISVLLIRLLLNDVFCCTYSVT